MAKKRKFVAYRSLERPYTRFSKFRKKSYIRTKPPCRVVRFDMGNEQKTYTHQIDLLSGADLQIRDNAIEAARQTTNRMLEKNLTKNGYKFRIMIYPHHILRENPLASGAGADRMSTGMSHSFGKVIGIAAQVRKNQTIMRLWVDSEHVNLGRQALRKARMKFPCNCKVIVKEFIKPAKPSEKVATKAAVI